MEAKPDEAVGMALAAILPHVTRSPLLIGPVATLLAARLVTAGMVELAEAVRAIGHVEVSLAGLSELAVALNGLDGRLASMTPANLAELTAAVTSLRDAINSGAGHGLGEPRGLAQ